MVIVLAVGMIGAGLFLLFITAQASDAIVNPRNGLRSVATVLIVVGGLILLGSLG